MTKQRTEWYPPEIKPVRKGVYETRIVHGSGEILQPRFSRWDGKQWEVSTLTPAQEPSHTMANQRKTWRGLAKEPK